MTEGPDADYAEEIRKFLVGRIAKGHQAGAIRPQEGGPLPTSRIQAWWILEGKEYRGFGRFLSGHWNLIDRHIRLLRATYNPRWRAVQAPEGEVDWVATAFLTLISPSPEFVCKSSQVGLTSEERAALDGWQSWIAMIWEDYITQVGMPPGLADGRIPWRPTLGADELELPRLRRWAHTARRSRWPFLRNVVAESLRVLFEGQELDRLPLPTEPATLFELVCIVRVLRSLCPRTEAIRWLDLEAGRNEIAMPGVTCTYQLSVDREQLLRSKEYPDEVEDAIRRHDVRLPKQVDALFRFKFPRAGFHGILLEAKSGEQSYDAALEQLRAYRAALREVVRGPILVWGVTEREEDPASNARAIEALKNLVPHRGGRDLWSFSSARSIPDVLRALGVIDPFSQSAPVNPLCAKILTNSR